MTNIDQYDYDLPEALIAPYPASQRTQSRLLHADCRSHRISDVGFVDLVGLIPEGSLLVVNDVRVIPARFTATISSAPPREVECLYLRRLKDGLIEIMAKPLKRLRPGTKLRLDDSLRASVERSGAGRCLLRLHADESPMPSFIDWLCEHGEIPLPPYLGRPAEKIDAQRYQTVYANRYGAVAAPTAGLHFDEDTLDKIKGKNIDIRSLTLQVGAGTFEPIRTNNIKDHQMHEEIYSLSPSLVDSLTEARVSRRTVVAVGTTVVRALESAALEPEWDSKPRSTRLMIRPGFQRRIVDALVTNFHLPRSSLMVMVCTLGGHQFIHRCYAHAIEQAYRFYSYGDAMYLEFDPEKKA